MRLGEPEIEPTPEELAQLNEERIEEVTYEVLPRQYTYIGTQQRSRLLDTIRQYVARRQKHAPRRLESRRRGRIQAKKAVAADRGLAQQSIDNILQRLYLSPVRTPNEWFQKHLDLINIGYSRTETSWCSTVEKQFLRLQGVLLELADLSIPELRSDQLDATQFVRDPDIFDYDLDDRRQDLHATARLLRQGRDAMADSGRPFLLRDVTETDTDFGATWRTVKAIIGEYLDIDPQVDHVDSVYVPNDLDNVRCIATSPAELDGEPIVHLRLQYYPIGVLEVESSCATVLGAERLSQTWYAGNEDWAEGYPFNHHHIRGHVSQLMTLHRCMKSHLDRNGCLEEDRPWIAQV